MRRRPPGRRHRGPSLLLLPLPVLLAVAALPLGWGLRAAYMRRRLHRMRKMRSPGALGDVRLGRLVDHTGRDAASGSVYSIQTATLTTETRALDEIWSPMHLERLARTYWKYVQRFSLGVLRVHYDDRGRYICLFHKRLIMLGFGEPEYEMGRTLGVVRWPLTHGLLISRRGRHRGYLEIEVHRRDGVSEGMSQAYVEIEVSSFYPAMSSGIAHWIYGQTQSRFHVLLAYGFIRSLATGDLAESVVGRFAPRLAVQDDGPTPERIPTSRPPAGSQQAKDLADAAAERARSAD